MLKTLYARLKYKATSGQLPPVRGPVPGDLSPLASLTGVAARRGRATVLSIVKRVDGQDRVVQAIDLDRATATDALVFVRELIDLFDLEALARLDGRTFDHPLAGGLGSLPELQAKVLRSMPVATKDRE